MSARALAIGLALASLVAGSLAIAQSGPGGYPTRQIRLVVTGTPGQGTDVLSRLIAQRLTDRIKQNVFVDNKPGAGGNIGADTAAKAPADGYTLLMATNATHAANPAMYARMPFDPLKDFASVAMVGSLPMMLSAAANQPVASVRDLVDAARAKPGSINVAIPSTSARVMLQLFNQLARVELFPVNYKGSGPAFIDLFGERVQLTIDTVSASLPHAAAGKLKPLAVTTGRRFEAVPNVPTMAESGVPGFDLAPWNALVAPRGTPREFIVYLNAHVVAVLAEPELRKRMVDLGIQPASGTPEQLDAFVLSEHQKWGELVRQAKIVAE
ncbi:MAG: Bug family tripartite tricarboxylate transporter substrate binding protein [Burkholderiales bacterium]